MKLSDELLLKSLRAGVLSGVADDHWDLVCKAVDDAGDIREVRGYARTVIFDAIEKFNPYHDELGQFTSGGAGGAGRSGGNQWDGIRPSSSDIDAEMQNLSAENKAVLMNSMRFEEGSREFRLSNPYRADTTKVLITNLQMAQESTAPKTKQPFLDTTDIESDMGGGAMTASDNKKAFENTLQELDDKSTSILRQSMQHEDDTTAFRMSNPYRANNAKVLLANLVAAQAWSAKNKQYTGKLYSEIAKEPSGQRTSEETARIVRNIAAARSQKKIDPAGWLGDGSKQRLPDMPGSKRKKK